MQRTLILLAAVLLVLGLAWPWLARSGLGRLPGDILIERGNTKIYLPLTSSLVVSLILSLIGYLLRR